MPTATRRSLFAGATAGVALAPAIAKAAPAPAAQVSVQRLAWAGVQLEFRDVAVFIDATGTLPDGKPAPPLATERTRRFALVTHHHGDHCDPVALKPMLGEQGYMVAEEHVARLINPHGVLVEPVGLYEPVFLSRGGAEFVAWSAPAVDGLGSPQTSWILDAGGRRMIHCGDTSWHGSWWDWARAYGPFDLALLPINGFRQEGGRFTHVGQPMSLTPEQAANAAEILGARLTVPMHYGAPENDPTYVEEPDAPKRFLKAMAANGRATRLLKPGETLTL